MHTILNPNIVLIRKRLRNGIDKSPLNGDSFGRNNAPITKIVENSEREYSYQYLKKTSTNKAGLNSLIHLKNHQPSLFEEWTGCSIWRSPIEIHNVIDVIMHLLFLGVVKE